GSSAMSTAPTATAPPRRFWHFLYSFRFWILLLLALLVILVAYYALADRYTPLTTDAYVQAYVVQVAPQVEGRVVKVAVCEGETVRAGALLFELDARPFEHKAALLDARRALSQQEIKGLEADLAAARAESERAEAEAKLADIVYEQERQLYKSDSTTERRYLE